ncbi:hypothetical protein B0H66DRAFT_27169 [Apodospora peruviana]|uniref:Uncharacterized protein n=1 Tax=Apodospora peruviana TaxID=516989 RepID=A0AAE0IR79_9PEZI|nr:hypothetical protein B0H66DRAFT_27169 [Apodospora peruviana]
MDHYGHASKYILGPLHDPEPNQVCATRVKALPPTPPASASPTRPAFGSSRHSHGRAHSYTKSPVNQDFEDQPFFRRVLSRSNSVNNKPLPPAPSRSRNPPISPLERKRSLHTSRPPQTRWNQGTILSRSNSVASSRPSTDSANTTSMADKGKGVRRSGSLAERYSGDKSHRPLEMLTRDHMAKDAPDDIPLRRGGSLRERYPGDMSHRPLAMLQRDHRAADRAPHLHNQRKKQPSDPIDALDHTGPAPDLTYHHSGPFDPTMQSRNVNKMYSPVEAVKETNMEALKATPEAYLKDSLDKHVPLQGIAVVPPGQRDLTGRRMEYHEGADLMRERDAAGGAYKRWDHIPYRDDDLKGKGEPSYTFEKNLKEKGRERAGWKQPDGVRSNGDGGGVYYEMQPHKRSPRNTRDNGKDSGARVRQRSVSHANATPRTADYPLENEGPFSDHFSGTPAGGSSGIQRRNTTGKSLAQSIKRRFGSLRRKKSDY